MAPQRDEPRVTCPILTASAGLGSHHRAFNFRSELRGDLRGYALPYAPEFHGKLGYFPGAHGRCGVLSGLGAELGYDRSLGVEARLAERELAATAFAHHAAILFRIPLGRFWITPRAGYHYRHFEIAEDFVPDARYLTLRPGLSLGVQVRRWFLELGGAPHLVIDAGSIAGDGWFPDASAFGFGARLETGVALLDELELSLGADFEAFQFTLHADPERSYRHGIAESAYDRYTSFWLALRVLLPGRAPRR